MEEKQSLSKKLGRVLGTLVIWLALALVAAVIVTLVANVRPCVQTGLSGCWASVKDGFQLEQQQPRENASGQPGPANAEQSGKIQGTKDDGRVAWAKPSFMDWVILVVSLIVAVRIMYPPDDLSVPPGGTTPAPSNS